MRSCLRCEKCYADEVLLCPDDGSNTKPSLPGAPIIAGRYRLERLLGRGATGTTYLGHDAMLHGRTYAVKIIRPQVFAAEDSPELALERFVKGAQAAASIRHPNVIDVIDYGETKEGLFYIVNDFVDGETLHRTLRRDLILAEPRALSVLLHAAAGVSAAHEKGVVHLSLSPAQIYLVPTRKSAVAAESEFARVGDFSLAAWKSEGLFDYGLVGTPTYVAPEQITSSGNLDARTDIYALGTIAFEMLCGRSPFTGDLMQLVPGKISNDPPRLSEFYPKVAPLLEEALMHALEREPERRPATMANWIEELEAAKLRSNETAVSSTPSPAVVRHDAEVDSVAQEYDVFISYRREGSSEAARAIRAELRQRQVRVFLDVDELRSGYFDQALLDCIARTSNFLVLLAPNSLDRCVSEGDWLRREIAHAVELKKNIVPVILPGFDFPEPERLPAEIRVLQTHQRVRYDHDYFDAMIERILRYLR